LSERPTGKRIDELIAQYAELQQQAMEASTEAKAKQSLADASKSIVVALVEEFGVRHAEKSKRLTGLRNSATTTTATRVKVDDAAVDKFRETLTKSEMPELSGEFFSERVTYQLVASPQEVLKRLDLKAALRRKFAALLGLCFQMTTNAPSLKVDVGAA
jgi:hypothetical protein